MLHTNWAVYGKAVKLCGVRRNYMLQVNFKQRFYSATDTSTIFTWVRRLPQYENNPSLHFASSKYFIIDATGLNHQLVAYKLIQKLRSHVALLSSDLISMCFQPTNPDVVDPLPFFPCELWYQNFQSKQTHGFDGRSVISEDWLKDQANIFRWSFFLSIDAGGPWREDFSEQ